ncbi:MAG: HNH endonuclease [Candidatus Heimdallarchaeota archaeon]|nr:MAG: HNH endonuclease [Candidatus Heimdallarchaeota archaeon]
MPIHTSFDNNSDEKLDVLRLLYLDFELSQRQLSKIFGCCVKSICKQLKKLDIKRSRSEVVELNWKHGQRYNYGKSGFKSGSEHLQWKGGRCYDSKGYILIYSPNHPLAEKRGYILEHRLIWFNHHPETSKNFIIHHLNGIRDDNRIENLIAVPRKTHIKDYPNTYIRILQERIRQLELESD